MRCRWSLIALVILASFPCHPALAAEPSLADKETARSLFFDGDEKYRAGDYAGALEAFLAADAIMGVATTGLEVGRTLVKLNRLLEAVETLQRVANLPAEENEVQVRARAEAASLLERVRARVPSIQVVVEGVGDAAVTLRIDEHAIPASAQGFPRKVDPGEHLVEVGAEGFRSKRRRLRLAAGQHEKLVVTLEPAVHHEVAPAPPAESFVEALPAWAWVGFGVGAAGMIAGAVTGGVTLANVADLEARCGGRICPPSEKEDLDEARVVAHASTACFVVGGVGLAAGLTGVVLTLVVPDDPDVAPLVGPGTLGLRARF